MFNNDCCKKKNLNGMILILVPHQNDGLPGMPIIWCYKKEILTWNCQYAKPVEQTSN